MLRLRPYKSCDAETIVSWIKDEYAFRQWCADRYDHYPITASDINDQYNSHSEDDWFYPYSVDNGCFPKKSSSFHSCSLEIMIRSIL